MFLVVWDLVVFFFSYRPFYVVCDLVFKRLFECSRFFFFFVVLWRESGRVDYEHLVNVLNELEKHEHVLL